MPQRVKIILILILSALTTVESRAQRLDSIARLLSSVPESIRFYYLDTLTSEHTNTDSILKYADIEIELAKKNGNKKRLFNGLNMRAQSFYFADKISEALNVYTEMLELAQEQDNPVQCGTVYKNMATIYSQLGDYSLSDEYYTNALACFREVDDNANMASVFRLQGCSYVDFNVFHTANEKFRTAMRIDSMKRDTIHIVEDLFHLGRSKYQEYLYLHDSDNLSQANGILVGAYFYDFKRARESNSSIYIHILKYLVGVYTDKAFIHFDDKKQIYVDSLKFFRYLADTKQKALGNTIVEDFGIYNSCFLALTDRPDSALYCLDSIQKNVLCDVKMHNTKYLELCHAYNLVYKSIGDYRNALLYNEKVMQFEREKRSQELLVNASKHQYEQEMRIQKAEEELLQERFNGQKNYNIALAIFSFVAVVFIFLILWGLHKNRKKNIQLEMQNIEISCQRDQLVQAKHEIEASIRYAERIQLASMPEHSVISHSFSKYYVIFRPLNIVSGDFYWATSRQNLTFLAVGDCTGHGVPGAFMSMLGISSLNDIIVGVDLETIKASMILDMLKTKIIESLHQTSSKSHDGMDIALIIYDNKTMKLQFAGAHRPLWILSNNVLSELKGDLMPVGFFALRTNKFTNQEYQLKKGDVLYLFSDGITDQLGGNNGIREKFTNSRLRTLICNTSNIDFMEQKAAIEKGLDDWRLCPDGSTQKQLDDQILVALETS